MKEKIKVILLIIIFIIILFLINNFMNNEEYSVNDINEKEYDLSENKEESMNVLEITNNNFEEEVLKSEKPVLVDFYANWCGPCQMLSPIVEGIAEENDDIKVCRINIDDNEDLAVKYEIMSIPTLIVIQNGEETSRTVGLVDKNEILEMIK